MADNQENQLANVEQNESTKVALSTLQDAATLVHKYAARIVGKERAQEFATHVSIMAQQNDKIRHCSPHSVVVGMMACVRLDLMPNTPEQYAHLIPYGNDLQFQLGYKGLVELAYRSGVVQKIDAELVFPEDIWEIEQGTERRLIHKLTAESLERDRTKADEAIFAYATAVLQNGERTFYVLSKSEIKKVKEKSVKAIKDGTPWKEWEEEQIKKTAVKRFTKLLPKSDQDKRLAYAVQMDSLAEAGKLRLDGDGNIIEGQVVADSKEAARSRMQKAEENYKKLNSGKFTPKAQIGVA